MGLSKNWQEECKCVSGHLRLSGLWEPEVAGVMVLLFKLYHSGEMSGLNGFGGGLA